MAWDIQSTRLQGHSGCRKAPENTSGIQKQIQVGAGLPHHVLRAVIEWRGGHLFLWYLLTLSELFSLLESCLYAQLWMWASSHLSGECTWKTSQTLAIWPLPSSPALASFTLPFANYTPTSWVLFQDATFPLTSGPLHMLFFLLGILFPHSWPTYILLTLQALAQISLHWPLPH